MTWSIRLRGETTRRPAVGWILAVFLLCGQHCGDGKQRQSDSGVPDSRVPYCGDGILDPGEECDDGPQNNNEHTGACRTDCRIQLCGNGQNDPGELCDDGNLDGYDSCPADCGESLTDCGDGVLDPGEQCDDGNRANWDGCTLVCQEAEFRVNTDLPRNQDSPDVAMAPDGRFVVVWTSSEGSPVEVRFCRYPEPVDYPPDRYWDDDIFLRLFRDPW